MNPELIGRMIAEAVNDWTTRRTRGATIVTWAHSDKWGTFSIQIAPNDAMMRAAMEGEKKRERNRVRKRAQ